MKLIVFFLILIVLCLSVQATIIKNQSRLDQPGMILADTWYEIDEPTNHCTEDTVRLSGEGELVGAYTLNRSFFPALSGDFSLKEVIIAFQLIDDAYDAGETINLTSSRITTPWSECNATGNSQISHLSNFSSNFTFANGDPGPIIFNITSIVNNFIENDEENISFIIGATILAGIPGSTDFISVPSKESVTFNEINFTYEDTVCSCKTSGDWIVSGSDNCVISSPCAMDGSSSFICSGSGTFTVTADITGWNSYEFNSGCNLHCDGGCFT